jgi:3,4-dihydroxy 2-butanone 4-phosphate synthase/GTP cyclohydrolase II
MIAAEFVTPRPSTMAKHGRRLICLTLTEQRCGQLRLPLLVANRSQLGTNHGFHRGGTRRTTGISATDQAHGSAAVGRRVPRTSCSLTYFPAHGKERRRAGAGRPHRAGCDLAQLSGLTPAAVIWRCRGRW